MNTSKNVPSLENATGKVKYTLTNDILFHIVLQDDDYALKGLIASLLHMEPSDIKKTKVLNPILPGDPPDAKLCILDIYVLFNDNSYINLEMQVEDQKNWVPRSLTYLSREFDQLKHGDDYTFHIHCSHISEHRRGHNHSSVVFLLSGEYYTCEEILPAYYQRQAAEQIFDFAKNYTKLLPLRTSTEATFNGHLLLSYIATCVVKMIQLRLKEANLFFGSRLACLRNQKCTIYENRVVTDEPQREANDTYKAFGMKCPDAIPIKDGRISYNPPQAGTIPKERKKRKKPKQKTMLITSQSAGDVQKVQKTEKH